MPINDETYDEPALRRDVGPIAIRTSIALLAIVRCLEAIRAGKLPSAEQIKKIEEMSDKLEESFDELSGWKP